MVTKFVFFFPLRFLVLVLCICVYYLFSVNFCTSCVIGVQHYSFACVYQDVSSPFVENSIGFYGIIFVPVLKISRL